MHAPFSQIWKKVLTHKAISDQLLTDKKLHERKNLTWIQRQKKEWVEMEEENLSFMGISVGSDNGEKESKKKKKTSVDQ